MIFHDVTTQQSFLDVVESSVSVPIDSEMLPDSALLPSGNG